MKPVATLHNISIRCMLACLPSIPCPPPSPLASPLFPVLLPHPCLPSIPCPPPSPLASPLFPVLLPHPLPPLYSLSSSLAPCLPSIPCPPPSPLASPLFPVLLPHPCLPSIPCPPPSPLASPLFPVLLPHPLPPLYSLSSSLTPCLPSIPCPPPSPLASPLFPVLLPHPLPLPFLSLALTSHPTVLGFDPGLCLWLPWVRLTSEPLLHSLWRGPLPRRGSWHCLQPTDKHTVLLPGTQ